MDKEINVKENSEKEEFIEKDPLKHDETKAKAQTTSDKINYIIKNITVEPTMFLFVIGSILTMVTNQNLTLEKACRINLNFSSEICDSLKLQNTTGLNSTYEASAQFLAAKAMSWKSTITATIPCALTLFIGSWSDKTGHRKLFIIIPILGQILVCINNMLNVFFFYQLPLEVLVFTEAFLEGISGSWCISFMAIFCYISSVTNDEERTFRMGIVNFALTVGFPIGMGASGIILRKLGYYGCYGLAVTVHTINLFYNTLVLRDPPRSAEQKKHDRRGAAHFLKTFFDVKNVTSTLVVVFGGPKKRRVRMIILLVVVSLLFGPMYGEMTILYLSTRYRFNWDEVMFSLFQSYNFISHTVGTMFSIIVFSKYLNWHDSVLGIISTVSKIAGSFVYCFAANGRIFFLAPIVEILNGTSLLALRSITSKIVSPHEFGKVNSIFALTEHMMPLLFVPLYTRVYMNTLNVLPGAVFLVGSAITLPAVAVFM